MNIMARAWRRVRALFVRDAIEDQIDREMRLHVELLTEEYRQSGLSTPEARRAALRRFGNLRGLTERGMDVRGARLLEDLLADLKHACRSLSRNAGPTATAVVTLALAIGANATVFTVVHSVLLRWPYPDAARLVRMSSGRVIGVQPAPALDFDDWKASSSTFDAIASFRRQSVPLEGDLEQPFGVLLATTGLAELVGMRPALGRLLLDGDFRPDADPVVVLAHQTWTTRFGTDPDVLGRTIRLGDALHTVVGVAEPLPGPLFAQGIDGIAAWVEGPRFDRTGLFPFLLGRLSEGATLAQAQAELDTIGHPSEPVATFLTDAFVAPVRPTLMALLGATGLILLIAMSNAANLLVAKASARQDELSVRAALGAGRGRLARLLLTESLLIALAGGAIGLVLAWAIVGALPSMEPTWIPRFAEIAIRGTAVMMTAAVTVVYGLLTGLASLVVLRGLLAGERKGQGRATPHDSWLRSGLVVAQVTLSLVLLAGSALTIRSYAALLDVPIGFDYRDIVTFDLGGGGFSMGPARPEEAARLQQARDVLERIRAVPGVQAATLTGLTPLSGGWGSTEVELLTGSMRGEMPSVDLVSVTEDFFALFRSRALAGRLFEPSDASRVDAVVVADANLARMLWPGEPAVGQRIRLYDVESEVIGVVEPVRYGALTQEMRPKLYHLLGRSGGGMFGSTFLVRHDGRERALVDGLEARVQEVNGSLRVSAVRSLSELYDQYLREPRFYMLLLGGLGLLALVVATVGIYGVVSYLVTRRTGEIGIRMALGARWPQIVSLFCRRTLVLVAGGLVGGLAGAAWLTRYVENLLFEVEPTDPIAFVAVAALLATTALAATLLPMRRALRVDPADTLRSE